MSKLLIEPHLESLTALLQQQPVTLLQAPPGSGKTTLVPLHLLRQPWLNGKTILMLEPRRVAARNAAGYMAKLLDQRVGEQVGYRMRLDHRIGPNTRVEVITEGMLTRKLQDDPALEDVGCLIFDEFHERTLQADLGLALALESQQLFNPALRILIMSATLNVEHLSRQLQQSVPLLNIDSEPHPLVIQYQTGKATEFSIERCLQCLKPLIQQRRDSILCFLPGVGEINRIMAELAPALDEHTDLYPLHGGLTGNQQDQAIRPAPVGRRKIVLATDIAETSLTLDGISLVVDSGLTRKPHFNPNTGMNALITLAISQDSATQRAGRAARQGPGSCLRLWSQEYQQQLNKQIEPEILRTDLAPLLLELSCWGSSVDQLHWLDPPPEAHLQQARQLLEQLDAIDSNGQVTALGEQMVQFGTHPRLAHMMLKAKELKLDTLGCQLAALLSEPDLFRARQGQPAPVDLQLRLSQFRHKPQQHPRIHQLSQRWLKQLNAGDASSINDEELLGLLLAFAYPDRIAKQRQSGVEHYLLRNGRGASLPRGDALSKEPWLVVAELNDTQANARIRLAASVSLTELEQHFSLQISDQAETRWNQSGTQIEVRKIRRLDAITLDERPVSHPDSTLILQAMLDEIRRRGLGCLPWDKASNNLLARLRHAETYQREQQQPWPSFQEEALLEQLESWLAPYLEGVKTLKALDKLDLHSILLSRLSWEQQQFLQQQLPSHWPVPSGSNIRINYTDQTQPTLPVRIQEVYGMTETPVLLQGQLKLSIQLLSPAQRPVQLTQDLAGFWLRTYPEVRKELKGRYPKHYWPEDPRQAQAMKGTKPRNQIYN